MKISVIITTYGEPIGLKKAIESVLLQDCETPELIVVDDNGEGSKYRPMVMEIVSNYNNLIYLQHRTNKKMSAARNTGINVANGEYIALLDDDDWFLPGKLSKQKELLDAIEDDYKTCVCWYRMIEEDGTYVEKRYEFGDCPTTEILWTRVIFTTSTFMFTKRLWVKIGGFDESLRRRNDIEFLARAGDAGTIEVVKEVLCERLMLRRNILKSITEEREHLNQIKNNMKEILLKYGPSYLRKTTDVFNEILFRILIKKKKPKEAILFAFETNRTLGCFKEVLARIIRNRIIGKTWSVYGKVDNFDNR